MLDFCVDIGFIEGLCYSIEIIFELWLEDELVVFAVLIFLLVCGSVTLEQLVAVLWILCECGFGMREIVDYLLLLYLLKFEMVMELGNFEVIKYAVCYGLGISCLL